MGGDRAAVLGRFRHIHVTFLGIVSGADHDAAHGKLDAGAR